MARKRPTTTMQKAAEQRAAAARQADAAGIPPTMGEYQSAANTVEEDAADEARRIETQRLREQIITLSRERTDRNLRPVQSRETASFFRLPQQQLEETKKKFGEAGVARERAYETERIAEAELTDQCLDRLEDPAQLCDKFWGPGDNLLGDGEVYHHLPEAGVDPASTAHGAEHLHIIKDPQTETAAEAFPEEPAENTASESESETSELAASKAAPSIRDRRAYLEQKLQEEQYSRRSPPSDVRQGTTGELYQMAQQLGESFGGKNQKARFRKQYERELTGTGPKGNYDTYGSIIEDWRRNRLYGNRDVTTPKLKRTQEFLIYCVREFQMLNSKCDEWFRQIVCVDANGKLNINKTRLDELEKEIDCRLLINPRFTDDWMAYLRDLHDGTIDGSNGIDAEETGQFEWAPVTEKSHLYETVPDGNPLPRDFRFAWNGKKFVALHYGEDQFDDETGHRVVATGIGECFAYARTEVPFLITNARIQLLQSREIYQRLEDFEVLPRLRNTAVYHVARGVPGCGKTTKIIQRLKKFFNNVVKPHREEYIKEKEKAKQRWQKDRQKALKSNREQMSKLDAWRKTGKSDKEFFEQEETANPTKPFSYPPYQMPASHRVLVLSPTINGRKEINNRIARARIAWDGLKVCTYDSAVLNEWRHFGEIHGDECYMVHAAVFDIVENICDPKNVYLYGDDRQIPFVCRVPHFRMRHSVFRPYRNDRRRVCRPHYMSTSKRCPKSICAMFSHWYPQGMHVWQRNAHIDCKLEAHLVVPTNEEGEPVPPNTKFTDCEWPGIPEGTKYASTRDEIWQSFTQKEKRYFVELSHRNYENFSDEAREMQDVSDFERQFRFWNTVHENQGRGVKRTVLVRVNNDPRIDSVFNSNAHRITAMTRNTHEFVYYTSVEDDLYRAIKNGTRLEWIEPANPDIAQQYREVEQAWADAENWPGEDQLWLDLPSDEEDNVDPSEEPQEED